MAQMKKIIGKYMLYKLLLWRFVVEKLFRIPEGGYYSKPLIVICWILFPIEQIAMKLIKTAQDPYTGNYTIHGMILTQYFFNQLATEGEIIVGIKNDNGILRIEKYYSFAEQVEMPDEPETKYGVANENEEVL
jgi:hypothetical protein